jgi:hypothetical protein
LKVLPNIFEKPIPVKISETKLQNESQNIMIQSFRRITEKLQRYLLESKVPSGKWSSVWLLFSFFLAPAVAMTQERLSSAEFSLLINEISEEGGYFFSDNFTSSEDSSLTIMDKLTQLASPGGAYIGVGPEQNFTFIAKIRPKIAFIVDIRRQAMIQHLMYKAIFHLSPTRADFLSLLLSRPFKAPKPDPKASIDDLVAYFSSIPADMTVYAKNLSTIRNMIEQEFQYALSQDDQESLAYIYRNFRTQGFRIGFEDQNGRLVVQPEGRSPTFADILIKRDLHGNPGCFLASVEDYSFVREMQEKNLIIPIVGDFGGKKALALVGNYLKKHGYIVSVFYVSNVELVLFEFGSRNIFPNFVENVKKLPIDARSLLIRTNFAKYGHPEQLPGYIGCTSLQKITSFLKEYDAGQYRQYLDLMK